MVKRHIDISNIEQKTCHIW